jgi:hypothetical protein
VPNAPNNDPIKAEVTDASAAPTVWAALMFNRPRPAPAAGSSEASAVLTPV